MDFIKAREENNTWLNRAERTIAQGALTNSKRPECFVKGVYPTHLLRGQDSYVWDTGGRQYIDFICGLGTNLLGYGRQEITAAIMDRITKGMTLSLGTDCEIRLAERIQEFFPRIERMKFLKTGSDACTAAIRIARAYTKRAVILSDGYHGWHDSFVSLTDPSLGVSPKDHHLKKLSEHFDLIEKGEVAAVILEPVITDFSQARIGYLRALTDKCHQHGTLMIFDEVITGLRFPKMSVTNCYGLEPDLICLGKALANGMPLSLVGGAEKIMNCGEYFVSSTFGGETLSLVAAQETLRLLHTKYSLDTLWNAGEQFISRFNSLAPDVITIEGYPTRGVFKGSDMNKALFWQEASLAGILFGPSFFFNFGHIALVDIVLNTCKDILGLIRTGNTPLKGEMPKSPFAQKMRERS